MGNENRLFFCPKRKRIVLEPVFFKGYAAMLVLGRVSHHRVVSDGNFCDLSKWPWSYLFGVVIMRSFGDRFSILSINMLRYIAFVLSLDQARVACTFEFNKKTPQTEPEKKNVRWAKSHIVHGPCMPCLHDMEPHNLPPESIIDWYSSLMTLYSIATKLRSPWL